MDPVTHFEIPVDNFDRAGKFYANTFGWFIMPVPGMDYALAITTETGEDQMPKKRGQINGGLQPRDAARAHPSPVINVPDIEAAIQKIAASGGSIVMPVMEVGGMGRYARFTDSEGNTIGLWQDLRG